MSVEKEIENRIFSTFSEVAGSIGYSPLHGKIIAVLLVKNKPISLQELAKDTGYSSSMISLSLDLLEVLGVIKKVKREGDRKLYVKLAGDLLECLKRAIIIKLEKSINDSLLDFDETKKKIEALKGSKESNLVKTLDILENEIKRLNKYVKLLSEIRLP